MTVNIFKPVIQLMPPALCGRYSRTIRAGAAAMMFALLTLCTLQAVAKADDMTAVTAPGSTLRKLGTGYEHSEGPVWTPAGELLFSDVTGDRMIRMLADGKFVDFRKPSGFANGNAFDRNGNLYSAQHDRRITRTDRAGKVSTVADAFEGKPLNSPNDVVVRSDGMVFFTDPPFGLMGYGPAKGESAIGFAGVYSVDRTGKVRLLTRDLVFPNGLAFSPNERTLYVNDTKDGLIHAFEVKVDGSLGSRRVFADLKIAGKDPFADGMKVDTQGNLYASNLDGVWVFSSAAKRIAFIPVPEAVSNLAFGGEGGQTLFITADRSLYAIRLRTSGKSAQSR